jgi:hypothetical protein
LVRGDASSLSSFEGEEVRLQDQSGFESLDLLDQTARNWSFCVTFWISFLFYGSLNLLVFASGKRAAQALTALGLFNVLGFLIGLFLAFSGRSLGSRCTSFFGCVFCFPCGGSLRPQAQNLTVKSILWRGSTLNFPSLSVR